MFDSRLWATLRISLHANYAYKNAPKCACSTIKRAFWWAEIDGGLIQGNKEATFEGEIVHAIEGSPFTNDPSFLGSKTVLAFVRNPYERIFSAYLDKCVYMPKHEPHWILDVLQKELGVGKKDVRFPDFLSFIAAQPDAERDEHWQSIFGYTAEDILPAHFIGSVETLEQSLDEVFLRLFPGLSPFMENRNSRKGIVTAPPPNASEFETIATLYEKDFTYYGYSFDPGNSFAPPAKIGWQ